MDEQATGDWFRANTSPNALQNIRLQLRPSTGSPLRGVDRFRPCVGRESSSGGSNTVTTEPYRSLPPGHQTALNTSSQACLDRDCPGAPLGLRTKPGLYTLTANLERRTLSQDIERDSVGRVNWVGPKSMDTAEIARRPHWDPPVPMEPSPRASNAPSMSQFPWQASHYSFGHPQMDLHRQSIHPAFVPQSLTSLASGFTLHPSVQQEPPYPPHLNPQSLAYQPRGVKILPRNWTPADPLPEGLCMSMLWNDLTSEYIPHIYPQHGPWRNVSGHEINPGLWGAPLDLSEDPPRWFSGDIDLGAPLIALPPEIDVAQYKYDTMAMCRQMVGTKPCYRFDPWADARLYEINE